MQQDDFQYGDKNMDMLDLLNRLTLILFLV